MDRRAFIAGTLVQLAAPPAVRANDPARWSFTPATSQPQSHPGAAR